jgi:hypothetical protein
MGTRRVRTVLVSLGLVAAAALTAATANDLIWNAQPQKAAVADLIWNAQRTGVSPADLIWNGANTTT